MSEEKALKVIGEQGFELGLKDQRIKELESCLAKAREALDSWINKVEIIHKDEGYKGIWFLAHNHGLQYKGPEYSKELEIAKEALTQIDNCLEKK